MNLKEAREIIEERTGRLISTNNMEIWIAKGFLEGYEAGVRDSAKITKEYFYRVMDNAEMEEKILLNLLEEGDK